MPFWGVEVRQGRPHAHVYDRAKGRLHVCKATLGNGPDDFAMERVLVQCSVGYRSPVLLCSLKLDGNDSCCMNVEFEESEAVIFSVIGLWSVHLTGFYMSNNSRANDDSEPSGESNLCNEEDEYEENEENLDVFPPPVSYSGGTITEDEKAKNGSQRRLRKNHQLNESTEVNSLQTPIALNGNTDESKMTRTPILDVDPRSSKSSKRKKECFEGRKAIKVDRVSMKNVIKDEAEILGQDLPKYAQEHNSANDKNLELGAKQLEKTDKKKENKKNKKTEGNVNVEVPPSTKEMTKPLGEAVGDDDSYPSQVRILPSGMVIKELEMGSIDGKVASHGKKVYVHFTGKLQEGDQVFDSNIGEDPRKFRLGGQKVIEGWNVGIDGMRVGGKRRLIIPPSLGYGSEGDGDKVPPNSWLVYDIKLVKAR